MLRHPSVESPSASLKPGKEKVISSALRFTVLLGVILVLAAASRALPLEANLSREGLRDLVALLRHLGLSWGAFGTVAIMILGVLGVLLNVPTVLVLIAVSLIYGPITAIVLTLIYWAIACYCIYFIGQRLGHEFVARCFSALPSKATALVNGNGFRTVLYLRLMMFAIPPLNWALATLHVTRRDYVLASVLGGLPHIVVWSTLGPQAIERMLGGQPGWWHAPEIIFLALFGSVLTGIVRWLLPPA